MMRLAYICADPGVPVFGRKGCSIHVQEVVRALVQLDVEVTLFARRFGGDAPHDLRSVATVSLETSLPRDVDAREHALAQANTQTRAALEAHGPFDAIYERHALWSWAAMEYARETGTAALLEVNAPLLEEQARYRDLINHDLAETGVQRAMNAADRIFIVSESLRPQIARHCRHPESLCVLPNGVNPDRFAETAAARSHRDPDTITIGFVGTLKPWHGVDALIEAVATLRADGYAVRALIVGDGPQRSALEAQAIAVGVHEWVEFTGAVDHDAVPALLGRMDIAVAPYPKLNDFYFSPLKLYEYMAAGCAIVASDIGQMRDVLRQEETALLYPPGQFDVLSRQLSRLCRDRALREKLGCAARARALAEHTWEGVAARIVQSIAECAARPMLREVG